MTVFGRAYAIHPRMTPTRLAYLQAVGLGEPYAPRHGRAANQCLHLGWVESVIKLPDGSLHSWESLPPGPEALRSSEWVGVRLTKAGRAAMREAGVAQK